MPAASLHNPDRYMEDLRQILSQGRKRIGILIGAGAPTAIRVDGDNRIAVDGDPLIPNIAGLTTAVVDALAVEDRRLIDNLKNDIAGNGNIEAILTQVRRLAQAIGPSFVHGLDANGYDGLGRRICEEIGHQVCSRLPAGPNPYSQLVSWISGTQREHSGEIFTPNYDLLVEEALSNVNSTGYDAVTQTLEVEFLSGRLYQYYGVPDHLYEQLMQTSSKGQFLHYYIKNSYPYSRVG